MLVCFAGTLAAAPSLPIFRPFVQPPISWTGPPIDPHASNGQWFVSLRDGAESFRPFEFYDNVEQFGGGPMSCFAISGYTTNIVFDPASRAITAFEIFATIFNDLPGRPPWSSGTNSHNEILPPLDNSYVGPLIRTKLTIEFAVSDTNNVPSVFTPPYIDPDFRPFIVAENEDQLAWYCWAPDNPRQLMPYGRYFVPTWDFGDIPPGGSVSRILLFSAPGGISPQDPRFLIIQEGQFVDILLNRTTSLKISTWLDFLLFDSCMPYPSQPLRGSNASVFHDIPEPAAGMLMVLVVAWVRTGWRV